MSLISRNLTGKFQHDELRRYVLGLCVIFWSLIVLVWSLYPDENHYSIMTHTFSFLGCYEDYHNPQWWWIFTLALVFWGLALMPLVLYVERRVAFLSARDARIGALLMLFGCVGIVCIGLFPEGHSIIFGQMKTAYGHMLACIMVEIGFGGGFLWHARIFWSDAKRDRYFAGMHRRLLPVYIGFASLLIPFLLLFGTGRFVIPPLNAADTASIHVPGSEWYRSLHTVYSFPFGRTR